MACYYSETEKKFVKQLRESLFIQVDETTININGAWHNNTAENTIRYLALQRNISGSFHESGARNYLVLPGIKETCRFQGKSFFKFLFSGETNLDKFEARNRKRRVSNYSKGS